MKRLNTDAVNAIVLAGGINRIPLYAGYTPGDKALLPFAGKPSIAYVLAALRGAPQVRRIAVVGPEEVAAGLGADAAGCDFLAGGDTLMDSLTNGLRHYADATAVLVTTADLPLLTPTAVTHFLHLCAGAPTAYRENIYVSAVPETAYSGAYQRFTKPYNRFRDVAVCHGNVALVEPGLLRNEAACARMNHIYSARKSAVTSALAIGWQVGLSYVVGVHLLHWLTLRRMARIASRRFKVGFIPILMDYPEITIDVDEAADYEFVKHRIEERSVAP